MPRRKGGVVDQDLRVYGTLNLRIADASIMPLIVSSHVRKISCFVFFLGLKVTTSRFPPDRRKLQFVRRLKYFSLGVGKKLTYFYALIDAIAEKLSDLLVPNGRN